MLEKYRQILRMAGFSQFCEEGRGYSNDEVWGTMEESITEVIINDKCWRVLLYGQEEHTGTNPDSLAGILGVTVK